MSVIHITSENFEKEVVNSEIPVLIDFWAPWCGPCQMMGPVFEELSTEFTDKVKFVKVNTEDNMELAQKYSISGIPALILANKGNEIDRIVGFAPKEILKSKIEAIL